MLAAARLARMIASLPLLRYYPHLEFRAYENFTPRSVPVSNRTEIGDTPHVGGGAHAYGAAINGGD